jgi:hypothetical protein
MLCPCRESKPDRPLRSQTLLTKLPRLIKLSLSDPWSVSHPSVTSSFECPYMLPSTLISNIISLKKRYQLPHSKNASKFTVCTGPLFFLGFYFRQENVCHVTIQGTLYLAFTLTHYHAFTPVRRIQDERRNSWLIRKQVRNKALQLLSRDSESFMFHMGILSSLKTKPMCTQIIFINIWMFVTGNDSSPKY